MAVAWFIPMSDDKCTSLLMLVTWFGRFSLVDVIAVLVLCISLNFKLAGGIVHVVCPSRNAIIAFGIVAIWALLQGEWTLRMQLKGALLAKYYAGFETRKNDAAKKCLDFLAHERCIVLLAGATLGLSIVAISGLAYSFQVTDVTGTSNSFVISFGIATIFEDVQVIDFPTGVCFVFCVIFPLLTSCAMFFWATTGQHVNFGLWCLTAARMCCLDVFFIACAVLGSEFPALIPAVINGVDPCYTTSAISYGGLGLAFCIPAAVCMQCLALVVNHKVQWTLSPELPYRVEDKPTPQNLLDAWCPVFTALFKEPEHEEGIQAISASSVAVCSTSSDGSVSLETNIFGISLNTNGPSKASVTTGGDTVSAAAAPQTGSSSK